MNKSDIKLMIIISLICIIIILSLNLFKNGNSKYATVYYDTKEILKIDMSINHIYEVNAYNGKVKIEVKNNKIRVVEEKSPLHLCSKQGYITNSYETIVCMPNKLVIEINNKKTYDTVIGD